MPKILNEAQQELESAYQWSLGIRLRAKSDLTAWKCLYEQLVQQFPEQFNDDEKVFNEREFMRKMREWHTDKNIIDNKKENNKYNIAVRLAIQTKENPDFFLLDISTVKQDEMKGVAQCIRRGNRQMDAVVAERQRAISSKSAVKERTRQPSTIEKTFSGLYNFGRMCFLGVANGLKKLLFMSSKDDASRRTMNPAASNPSVDSSTASGDTRTASTTSTLMFGSSRVSSFDSQRNSAENQQINRLQAEVSEMEHPHVISAEQHNSSTANRVPDVQKDADEREGGGLQL